MNRRLKMMTLAALSSLVLMMFFQVRSYREFTYKRLAREQRQITQNVAPRLEPSFNTTYVAILPWLVSEEYKASFSENTLLQIQNIKATKYWSSQIHPANFQTSTRQMTSTNLETTHRKTTELTLKKIKAPGKEKKPICGEFRLGLRGKLNVDSNVSRSLEEARAAAGLEMREGCYKPSDCESQQRVAIVIPYKERYQHLLTLLHHLHPVLQRQRLHYCVIVAEQFDDGVFNKARVMNAAFAYITEHFRFDCFIFHDVDMLLEDDRNIYECGNFPKHLSPAIDKFNYTLNYGTKFGGVTAIRAAHYRMVNGHSNRFWGWGGEDNDMEQRLAAKRLTILKVNETIGRYKMITHEHPWWFDPSTGLGSHVTMEKKLQKIYRPEEMEIDPSGVSNIKYTLTGIEPKDLWTKYTFDIRDFAVESATVRMQEWKKPSKTIKVQNPKIVERKMETPSNDREMRAFAMLNETRCAPTYAKLTHMALNRTKGSDEVYRKVYFELDEAKRECDKLEKLCHAIVEQARGKFSLRSTALVHENVLIYKYGIDTQYDVTESHHTLAVYVKICRNDPDYTQFFPDPFLIHGDNKAEFLPKYETEFVVKTYNGNVPEFSFRYLFVTTHRAAMEQKIKNGVIQSTWWDSLGGVQRGKKHLPATPLSDGESQTILHIKTPPALAVRQPGCYVAQISLWDEANGVDLLEWRWWFQIRAANQEMEEAYQKRALENSLRVGREYGAMMVERNKALQSAVARKRKNSSAKSRKAEVNEVKAKLGQ